VCAVQPSDLIVDGPSAIDDEGPLPWTGLRFVTEEATASDWALSVNGGLSRRWAAGRPAAQRLNSPELADLS